ncbi:MAG: AzlD family protein [Aestuariivirgaceae bacterium]
MEADPLTLLTIAGMALATYATRAGGFALMHFMNVKGRLKAALDAMPPAILMAVIAPTVFATGVAETLAAIITAIAAIARLPLIAVVVIGVLSVVLLRMVL